MYKRQEGDNHFDGGDERHVYSGIRGGVLRRLKQKGEEGDCWTVDWTNQELPDLTKHIMMLKYIKTDVRSLC